MNTAELTTNAKTTLDNLKPDRFVVNLTACSEHDGELCLISVLDLSTQKYTNFRPAAALNDERRQINEAQASKIRMLSEAQVSRMMIALREDMVALDRESLKDFMVTLVEQVLLDPAAETFQITYLLRSATGDKVASPRGKESIPGSLPWLIVKLRAA